MSATIDHASLMDRVYRLQRRFGIYDATRKYYLLGRDEMLAGLNAPRGGTILEIGCGTGRNLVSAAELYPSARLFGVDISRQMLLACGKAVAGARIADRTRLAMADAVTFDAGKVFGRTSFDRVYMSYAVSMIPGWEQAIERAVELLAPGGELHIVDFGDLAGLPRWSERALAVWLQWYHVTPRRRLIHLCGELARQRDYRMEEQRLYRGFAWVCILRRPDRLIMSASDLAVRPNAA